MIRKILLTIAGTILAVYLLLALTAFNRRPSGVCSGVELVVKDSTYAGFVTKDEIMHMLKKNKVDPTGLSTDSVRCGAMEKALAPHPLIDRAECFLTPGHKVCVEVSQRIPILHVLNSAGEDYFVDHKGRILPSTVRCVAMLPIATGHVDRHMATGRLCRFALYLGSDAFWNAQVEQINVLPDSTVELVPRVGNHIIYLGRLEQYDRKLNRVKEFYAKALNTVGWNKYSRISVEFGNQVICTKRKE